MNKLVEQISNAKKIAIFSHIAPDADALCSSLALKNLLRNNFDYKYIDVFNAGPVGDLYAPILRDEAINPTPYSSYDLAFVMDCANLARIGDYKEIIKDIPVIINIDHHETNNKFGAQNYVASKASSTSEILYLIAKANGWQINNVIAKQLYQGIITDTNCFTSLSINKRTFQAISDLLTYKFDSDAIKEYYFKNNSVAKTKLISKALSSLKFYKGEKFTTMKIPFESFEKFGANFEDTLGIIDNGINICGTEVSAILVEKEIGKIHVSLRSKGQIDVGEIAKQFNGGGSLKLAAYQTTGDIKEAEKDLCNVVNPLLGDETTSEILF